MAENQLAFAEPNPREVIGGNFPPLAEQLAEEIVPFRVRADDCLARAGEALIIDDESCGKVVDLVGVMRALHDQIDAACELRLQPYKEAIAQIQRAYRPIELELEASFGPTSRHGLRGMVDAYDKKRRADAEAEKQRLQAEQRQREAEAEAARRAAEEKTKAGSDTVADKLAVLQAEGAARRLANAASAVRPAPIRAALGQVRETRAIAFEITDLRKLLGWILRGTFKVQIEKSVTDIMRGYLRTLGVDAVEAGRVDIPGLAARIERGTAIGR